MSIHDQNMQLFSMSPNSGYVDPNSMSFADMQAQAQQHYQQQAAQKQAGAGVSRVNDAAAGIQRNTEGRANELSNDPRMNSAMDFFGRVMGGAEGPYTDASKGAMLTQRANGSSAAMAAQMSALRDAAAAAGGSMQDPSFQAKAQELNAMRQGSNMDAQSAIEADAANANFGAKMSGAGQLASTRGAQNAQINQMRGLAAEHQGRVTAAVPSGQGMEQPQQPSSTATISGQGFQQPQWLQQKMTAGGISTLR